MRTTRNCAILLLGYGYADYYRYQTKTNAIQTYSYDSTKTSDYDYDELTGEFSSNPGAGYWSADTPDTINVMTSNDYYNASFDSVNILFNKETVNANDIQMFLKAATSMQSINITWASDSNFVFQTANTEKKLHEKEEETASFNNDTIHYKNAKQIVIKEIKPLSRVARSIKFRVSAIMSPDTLDEIRIHHIEVLPSGLLFVGDNNA